MSQTIHPYVPLMAGLASKLKVWIFPEFCSSPRIFAARQLHVPGFWGIFGYLRIFSSLGGGGTDITFNQPRDVCG